MKFYGYAGLFVLVSFCLCQDAAAQSHWDQPTEIGSYQSIVARANLAGPVSTPTSARSVVEWQPRPELPAAESNQQSPLLTVSSLPRLPESSTTQIWPASHPTNPPVAHPASASQPVLSQQSLCQQEECSACCCHHDQACRSCKKAQGICERLAERKAEKTANWVVGSRALFFSRTREAGIPLATNEYDTLWTRDNSYRILPGGELSLIRRNCAGNGQEIRYWGLYPEQRIAELSQPEFKSYLAGLDDYFIGPESTNVQDIYEFSDSLQIRRRNEFHNVEINLLRNGGTYLTPGGNTGSFELLGGFRWLYFNEDFSYSGSGSESLAESVSYDLAVRNNLTGLQLGARNEIWICNKVSLISGTKFGLFNNRIRSRQSISNGSDDFAWLENDHYPDEEIDFDTALRKNDLAAIGELELGVAYQFAQRARLSMGYRVLGISGVALAPGQIPHNFSHPVETQRINSKDSLILGGAYSGIDICF
jgi:hypothetical protein